MGFGNDMNASLSGFLAVDDDLLKALGITDSETTCAVSECEPFCELTQENVTRNLEDCESHYQGMLDEARIGPWTKRDTGEQGNLYCFTDEMKTALDTNRQYLKCFITYLTEELLELKSEYEGNCVPEVERILRSGNATIVFWDDGDKTIVKKAPDEADSDYIAFTAALGKKIYGSNSKLSRFIKSKIEYQKPKEPKKTALPSFDKMVWTSYSTTINHEQEGSADANT